MALKIWYASPDLASADLKQLCSSPDEGFEPSRRILKDDKTTTLQTLVIDMGKVVVKRYNTKNIWHLLRRNFQTSRALNCFQMSKSFIEAGVPVAESLASVESTSGPFKGKSWFVTKFLDGKPLMPYLQENPDSKSVDRVVIQIKQAFKILLKHKLSHGDMKATNLVMVGDTLHFIDLDGAKGHQFRWKHRQAVQKDANRFMKNWQNNPMLKEKFGLALVDCGLKDIK